jgi:hypothetical protein
VITSRTRRIVARALRFDLSDVRARYALEHRSTDGQARILERELKRYLILCALHPRTKYGMTGPTDDLWHTFVLFTKQYARFCDGVAGRFLHHTPGRTTGREFREFKTAYGNLFRDYRAVFGETPPASIWPSLDDICRAVRREQRRRRTDC